MPAMGKFLSGDDLERAAATTTSTPLPTEHPTAPSSSLSSSSSSTHTLDPNTDPHQPQQQWTVRSLLSLHSPPQKGYELPFWHKAIVLFIVSWMTLAVTFSSTSLLPATPEIAAEFATTTEIINVTNAGVLLAMGFSSLIWGPMNALIGRRVAYLLAISVLCGCSVGAAVAGDMRVFTAMRVLGGLTGTGFMVTGQTVLADCWEPTVRGTAVGFFMAGTVAGPAIGPCIGGIIVTFASWRNIYWVQVAMTGFGLVLAILFVPELSSVDAKKSITLEEKAPARRSPSDQFKHILQAFNPMRVFKLWIYPNIFLADLTCGLLSTFQYAILTSARSIFNPRFHLSSALVSGLFYLAPGAGFLVGSIVGGRLSDRTVKRYIAKRNGTRLPQDRLNSGLITLLGVLPAGALVYGWTLQEGKGGMAVPIIAAFFGGCGLMGSFNGLNTYAAEALPHRRSEVISGKYIIQYLFSAGSSAAVDPLIGAIGVGWTFTICVFFSIFGGVLVMLITRWGLDMQRWVQRRVGADP
ncbi:putative MFS transporter [Aspergillus fijiensis CBS 313.89]|uniref:MFS general substrate transporter n=1 Tax=Aspergillus fijiensis CBS 313.89 TaxID=1448319 RepID=A0A8G1VV08_9EURO|nr:MFS general substrate transporter [Aspergillus fijiensis CBS 313.89]RAK73607.1 MFS general substrate transporter [Aspergillus fijiensis CBS 313.89]